MKGVYKLTKKLKVFVSSKDYLDDERRTIEAAIEELGMEPVLTQTDRWVGTRHKDEYLRQISNCQIMIVLLEKAPKSTSDEEEFYKFVKEEVEEAFAQGVTVLLFLKNGKSSSKFLSNFLKSIQGRLFNREFSYCIELYKVVQEALLSELFEWYGASSQGVESREEFYRRIYGVLRRTFKRVYIVQKTPLLLFGPRKNMEWEKSACDALVRWSKSLKSGENKELICIYDANEIENEIKDKIDTYDIDYIKSNQRNINEIFSNEGNLKLIGGDHFYSCGVFDHEYFIWMYTSNKGKTYTYTGIHDRSPGVSDMLASRIIQYNDSQGALRLGEINEIFEKIINAF